jgi:peptidase E
MRSALVAIGGGVIRTRGTAEIDREIIRLSNRKCPTVLFIPTASSDSGRYCQRFVEHFGKFLNCKTDVLRLVDEPPSVQQIEKKIFSADIIYVGGGNTLFMMRVAEARRGQAAQDGLRKMESSCPASVQARSIGLIPATPTPCLSITREIGNTST